MPSLASLSKSESESASALASLPRPVQPAWREQRKRTERTHSTLTEIAASLHLIYSTFKFRRFNSLHRQASIICNYISKYFLTKKLKFNASARRKEESECKPPSLIKYEMHINSFLSLYKHKTLSLNYFPVFGIHYKNIDLYPKFLKYFSLKNCKQFVVIFLCLSLSLSFALLLATCLTPGNLLPLFSQCMFSH